MEYIMVKKQIIFFILALALLFASFLVGCRSDGNAPTEIDLPSQAAESTSTPIVTLSPTPSSITLLSADTQADFPKSLTFNLEVESDGEITGIELRYKIIKVTSASVITSIKPDFTPGHRVKTSWVWDARKASLPPGAEIEYQWIIKNAAEDSLKTDAYRLVFDDSRYEWRELSEGKVRIFWYDGNKTFGQELMNAAQEALDKLSQDTGAQHEKDSKIYIYASSEDLQDALVYSQDWMGGIAFTDYSIVAIGVSPGNLDWGKRTVAHELAHLVIGQVTFNPYSGLPTWLDEGLAMYAEGELREDLEDKLKDAISENSLFSVRSLISSFPADTQQAGLAYAQSYGIVSFLIDNYGSDKMLGLLHVFQNGSSPDDALSAVYGFDSDGLDGLWRASL
jgi:hypothetical protein